MPRTTTKTATGLTDSEQKTLDELLERQRRAADGHDSAELTDYDRTIASLLRERDHREGCPAHADPGHGGASRIEAYGEKVIAPGPELRGRGMAAGDAVVVVHCMTCGNVRYFPGGQWPSGDPVTAGQRAVESVLIEELGNRGSADEDLDETLS